MPIAMKHRVMDFYEKKGEWHKHINCFLMHALQAILLRF